MKGNKDTVIAKNDSGGQVAIEDKNLYMSYLSKGKKSIDGINDV